MKSVHAILKPTLLAATLAATSLSLPASAQSYPAVVEQMISWGVTIDATFDAPGGLTGYVGHTQGRVVAFYLTPDREHVVVGPMLDAKGENLTDPMMQKLVVGPQNKKAWSQLEKADWIRDGSADAPVIVYTFTDPDCPYCHRFRQIAEPWIAAGRVQLRQILVGILRPDSLPKAATIFGSKNPAQALRENQHDYNQGGIAVDQKLVSANAKRVEANNQLMASLNLSATPSTYYRDSDGNVQMKQGAPQADEMKAIMGSDMP